MATKQEIEQLKNSLQAFEVGKSLGGMALRWGRLVVFVNCGGLSLVGLGCDGNLNVGIAFIKASDVPEDPGELFYCRLREPSLAEETGIAYRRDNRSKALGSFVGLVRNRFRAETGGLSLNAGVGAQDTDSRQLTLF